MRDYQDGSEKQSIVMTDWFCPTPTQPGLLPWHSLFRETRGTNSQPSSGMSPMGGWICLLKSANPTSPMKSLPECSSTAQYPNPKNGQCPAYRRSLAHVSSSEKGLPPINRVTSGSAHIAADAAKSCMPCGRKRSRSVTISGIISKLETAVKLTIGLCQ
jgi:hypothetical protein